MNDDGGVKAFFGKWPGDETDEELLTMLREVRREGPRWIPVGELLPEPFIPVLVWFASPATRKCKYAEVTHRGLGGDWQHLHKFDKPTHWMPLPEPPPEVRSSP
ncbi:MAG: DUF551 domain-containing protein [Caulobacteraceae bacterium]|nr:DUF551 domain-containing protein [Caulobacteraceae bacterium]